jgi:small-conductance mechanosensitive channel
MAGIDEVLAEPAPDALVVALAEGTVNIRARWWITPPRRMDAVLTRDKVLTAIIKTLTENGIDLPYPTRQILLQDQTEVRESQNNGRR